MSARLRAPSAIASNHGARLAIGLGILIALTACGGGGGDDSGGSDGAQNGSTPTIRTPLATSASNLFPLDANGVSVYSSTASADSIIVRVVGTTLLAD